MNITEWYRLAVSKYKSNIVEHELNFDMNGVELFEPQTITGSELSILWASPRNLSISISIEAFSPESNLETKFENYPFPLCLYTVGGKGNKDVSSIRHKSFRFFYEPPYASAHVVFGFDPDEEELLHKLLKTLEYDVFPLYNERSVILTDDEKDFWKTIQAMKTI